MENKILQIVLLIVLFTSCAYNKQKVDDLQTKIYRVNYQNDSLSQLNRRVENEINDLKKSYEIGCEEKEIVKSFLKDSLAYVLDKGAFADAVFGELNNCEGNITNYLLVCSNKYRDLQSAFFNCQIVRCLWHCLPRNKDAVKGYLNDGDKLRISSLLKSDGFYERSGMSALAEGLLMAYQEFRKQPFKLKELHENLYGGEMTWQERDRLINSIVTKGMREVLSDDNYGVNSGEFDSSWREFYVCTFWARRYHEGNIDEVYNLINDIHNRIL